MKNNNNTIYQKLMSIGRDSGCHQMPERSFFINGKQFPVCARCTGVLVGNLVAYIMFVIYIMPLKFYMIGCAVMFMDWFLQYIDIRQSTNIRRLITGIIGGYSVTTLHCVVLKNIIQYMIK